MSMLQELQNKHILVDTNILSGMFYNPDAFQGFLQQLLDLSCQLTITEYIKLEFLRIARNKTQKLQVAGFLKSNFYCLPNTQDIFDNAIAIYPLYTLCSSIQNQKQVSIVDALNVAFLNKYNNNLYFVTLDNNDYPLEIMDRISIGAIDIGKQILTWGIYKFNDSGLKKLEAIYNAK